MKVALDDIVPQRLLAEVEAHERIRHWASRPGVPASLGLDREHRTMLDGSLRARSLGVRTTRLLDWRGLERRYASILVEVISLSSSIGSMTAALMERATSAGCSEAWLFDGEDVLVVRGRTYERTTRQALIAKCIDDPRRRGAVAPETDASVFASRVRRRRTLLGRKSLYRRAFKLAVEARLTEVIDAARYEGGEEPTFIVTNDGRRYVVCLNEDGFRWRDGACYECT